MEVFSINQNTEEMNCTILVIAMVLLRSKLSRLVENTKKTRAFSESLDLIGELLDKYGFTELGIDLGSTMLAILTWRSGLLRLMRLWVK